MTATTDTCAPGEHSPAGSGYCDMQPRQVYREGESFELTIPVIVAADSAGGGLMLTLPDAAGHWVTLMVYPHTVTLVPIDTSDTADKSEADDVQPDVLSDQWLEAERAGDHD